MFYDRLGTQVIREMRLLYHVFLMTPGDKIHKMSIQTNLLRKDRSGVMLLYNRRVIYLRP